ncbi:hypothetical protein KI387_009820, partial [Taxus chinensis]
IELLQNQVSTVNDSLMECEGLRKGLKLFLECHETSLEFYVVFMVTVETMAEVGDPKDTVCDAVEKMQIDLLVVGNHGYGMVKRTLLGSVSSYCVNHAKCPVLV